MEKTCDLCDRLDFKDRIIWEDSNFFISATRGQITDYGGYLLLAPKKHILCVAEMDEKELKEADNLSKLIISSLKKEYNVPQVSFFEHGIVGQTVKHAHIHFIPGLCPEVDDRIRKDFPESCISFINSISELTLTYQMGGSLVKGKPYLMVGYLFPKIFINPMNVPPQYLRIVYADAFGRPERANWRNVDPDKDHEIVLETVHRMKKYFP